MARKTRKSSITAVVPSESTAKAAEDKCPAGDEFANAVAKPGTERTTLPVTADARPRSLRNWAKSAREKGIDFVAFALILQRRTDLLPWQVKELWYLYWGN